MMIPFAVLLAACEVEPSPKDSAGVDSPVEDTAADTADTGETGDSGDSEDTADSADTGDSGDTAEVDTCDPSASVHRDTGPDTAPILDYLAPVDTGTLEFLDTGNQGDCETSPTDAFGHPRLACADLVVEFGVRKDADFLAAEAEWLGDLDGDGADEVVVTVVGDDRLPMQTWLRYGGTPFTDVGEVEPSVFADAWSGATDDRVVFRGGDFNGDGLADLLTEAPYGELGVLLSDGGRYSGEVTAWPELGSWTTLPMWLAGYRLQAPFPRLTWSGDVDGDGLDDLVASHSYQDALPSYGVAVLRGDVGFTASGALYDQADWRLYDDTMCSETLYCNPVMGVPVGDLDGDGSAELLVSSGDPGDTHYIVSPVDLPRCSLPVIDAAWASLVDEDPDFAGTSFFAVPGPADFDGDGHADLALTTSVGDDPDGLVTWIARGGERFSWSRDLRTLPDRVEFPRGYRGDYTEYWSRYPLDVSISDSDGDGRDDLVVGGKGDPRGRVEIVRAPAGVVDAQESATIWVTDFNEDNPRILTAYGRGDLDADGTEDLMVLFTDYYLRTVLVSGATEASVR